MRTARVRLALLLAVMALMVSAMACGPGTSGNNDNTNGNTNSNGNTNQNTNTNGNTNSNGNGANPMLIPGGGVASGAISGTLHVHVINAENDAPLAGAWHKHCLCRSRAQGLRVVVFREAAT